MYGGDRSNSQLPSYPGAQDVRAIPVRVNNLRLEHAAQTANDGALAQICARLHAHDVRRNRPTPKPFNELGARIRRVDDDGDGRRLAGLALASSEQADNRLESTITPWCQDMQHGGKLRP